MTDPCPSSGLRAAATVHDAPPLLPPSPTLGYLSISLTGISLCSFFTVGGSDVVVAVAMVAAVVWCWQRPPLRPLCACTDVATSCLVAAAVVWWLVEGA
jgi:hypothetical protein